MPERGRTLIVTGASSGIGRAVALAAAQESYRIVMVARRAALLDEVVRSIAQTGAACIALAGDVTDRAMPARIVDAALQTFGRIDVLLNNAGGGAYGALLECTDAEIEAQWQLNLAAPLRIARAALPHLEATRGQMLFIGSGVVRVPLPAQGAYALSKAALRAATIQLRRELRRRGVAVTYVDPGVAATEFHSSIRIERPPGPIISPQRVARAILRGIARRSAVINAVPWQTAFTTVAEWMGTLVDPVVTRLYTVRRVAQHDEVPASAPGAEVEERARKTADFDETLEPVARRMERVKLPQTFLRDALVPGATLELTALAMQWTGMPNKNERAALREALDALEAGGYLQPMEDDAWRVIRAAD